MFRINMLPAGNGDALWVEYGDAKHPTTMLIDAGHASTYKAVVASLGPSKTKREIRLFCVTHIDSDHIEGAVKLLTGLPSSLKVKEVWFNGWDQISRRLGARQAELLGAAIVNHAKASWNKTRFGGKAVVVPMKGRLPEVEIEGLRLTILSPWWEQLDALKPDWVKECKKAKLIPGDIDRAEKALKKDRLLRPRLGAKPKVEKLAGEDYSPDSSPSNASSIAFLAELDSKSGTRSCLFAGDAYSEVLVQSLERLCRARNVDRLKVDALKVPHHGSMGNSSPALLELIDCQHYLFSSNGDTYGHPDRQTIARILQPAEPAVKRCGTVELWFNYRTAQNKCWDDGTLRGKYKYKTHYPPSGEEGISVDLE